VLGLALASSPATAATTVTIGQLGPFKTFKTDCTFSPIDIFQSTVASGASYVVPPGGAKLTSWTTYAGHLGPGQNSGAGNGQMMEMKVFRFVSDVGPTYMAVGHDEQLLKSGLNTFATNIAVKPGDVLGLNDVNANGTAPEGCEFAAAGETRYADSDLADGDQATFTPESNLRLNIQAVVQLAPGASPTGASAFSFGKVKDNKKKGTVILTVDVPGPGTLSLAGSGVKTERFGGAAASKAVNSAGPVKLLVRPKGKTKHKLAKTGKAKVKISVTYTPTGGNPATQSERVKLVKKR
jgi:hypothetical protein